MASKKTPLAQTSPLKGTPLTQLNANGKRTKRGLNAEGVANGLNKAIRCGEDYMNAHNMIVDGKVVEYYRCEDMMKATKAFVEAGVAFAQAYVALQAKGGHDLDMMTSKSIGKGIGLSVMLDALFPKKDDDN